MSKKARDIPYVSLFRPKARGGKWSLSFTLGQRHHESLGFEEANARKRAKQVSGIIDLYKSKLIPLDEALRKVGAHHGIDHYVELFAKEIPGTEHHQQVVGGAIRNFVRLAEIRRPEQLTPAACERVKDKLVKAGKAPRTVNYWMGVARRFGRWLKNRGVLADSPIEDVSGISGGTRRPRRPATAEDVAKLCRAALKVGTIGSVSGETRRLLYLTAFATGLRYGELTRVKCHDLLVVDGGSRIKLPPSSTKNRQEAVIPVPLWLATELSDYAIDYMGEKTWLFPDAPPRDFAKYMKRDLAAAGISQAGEAGYLDFHSLRHGFVTALSKLPNMDIKTLQTLARHSTALLTLNVYTHAGALEERAKAVEQAIEHPEGVAQ